MAKNLAHTKLEGETILYVSSILKFSALVDRHQIVLSRDGPIQFGDCSLSLRRYTVYAERIICGFTPRSR